MGQVIQDTATMKPPPTEEARKTELAERYSQMSSNSDSGGEKEDTELDQIMLTATRFVLDDEETPIPLLIVL